jgi:hypothetical protein
MAYRIDFSFRDGTLCAVVGGRCSASHAAAIGRDIADQASEQHALGVLIDLRGLAARLGNLGALLEPASARTARRPVAVIDDKEAQYYVFSELRARAAGGALRCFSRAAEAWGWLYSCRRGATPGRT